MQSVDVCSRPCTFQGPTAYLRSRMMDAYCVQHTWHLEQFADVVHGVWHLADEVAVCAQVTKSLANHA
jgi:hypothetical protein